MSDGIFSSFRNSAMALRAQRIRLDVAAENLANVETTRTVAGGPYRPKTTLFQATAAEQAPWGPAKRGPVSFRQLLATHERHMAGGEPAASSPEVNGPRLGVQVLEITEPFTSEYNPTHPDADETGVVLKPNVDPIGEMMTLIKATRAYEANATALDAAKQMLNRALDI